MTVGDQRIHKAIRRHKGSLIAVRTIVNSIDDHKEQGRGRGGFRVELADRVVDVLENKYGLHEADVRGRSSLRYTNMSKVYRRVNN